MIYIISENTEVLIFGYPDPFQENAIDYREHCLLKDSLLVMNKHLDELNLNEDDRLYYQFSVLLVKEDGHYKLIYSYFGNKKIKVREEFDGMLHFTPQLMVEVHKVLLS